MKKLKTFEDHNDFLDSGQHNKVRQILDNIEYIKQNPDEFDDIDLWSIKYAIDRIMQYKKLI